MKNKLIGFLLLLMMLVMPLQAKSSYRLLLNGLTFEPTYTPIISQNHLFLSLDDLADMTYSSYTELSKQHYLWSINQTTLDFTLTNNVVKINQEEQTVQASPFMVGNVVYVPVNYLTLARYPYILSTDLKQFQLTSLSPASILPEVSSAHTTLATDYTSLEQIFAPLLEKDTLSLIETATTSKQYLSFASTAYKKEILTAFSKIVETLPDLEVTFRNLDTLDEFPTCSQLSTYPLKVTCEDNGLLLMFNNQEINYKCLWPTYNPSATHTSIDVNKSLDVMIMRALYEHYRDTYDLKDDLHFSPITTVKTGSSESITYNVYSDHLLNQTHTYTVTIYKYATKEKINYIVDLASHAITS